MVLEFIEPEILTQVDEVQLIYRSKIKPSQRPSATNSKAAYGLFKEVWDKNLMGLQEQFKVMLLNARARVLGILNVTTGGIDQTVVDPRLVFAAALKAAASSIIIAHNHPSGEIGPSKHDEILTRQLVQCGKLLMLKVRDHLILTAETYYSFADDGVLE
jgi:DNA repair protein RadC